LPKKDSSSVMDHNPKVAFGKGCFEKTKGIFKGGCARKHTRKQTFGKL
jgi:hypothetical protein